jgi:hypothetical protein
LFDISPTGPFLLIASINGVLLIASIIISIKSSNRISQ